MSITVGERTEIALNVCLDNGIPKSAGDVVKKVSLYNPAHPQTVIWVQFDHQCIGRKTCLETMQLYTKDIDKAWPPVKSITTQFNVGRNRTALVVMKQFPLSPTVALTA